MRWTKSVFIIDRVISQDSFSYLLCNVALFLSGVTFNDLSSCTCALLAKASKGCGALTVSLSTVLDDHQQLCSANSLDLKAKSSDVTH